MKVNIEKKSYPDGRSVDCVVLRLDVDKKDIKADDDAQVFRFEGMASTFGNVDRQGDIIEPGAFAASLERRAASGDPVPALWSHRSDMPIGVFTRMEETEEGLFASGELRMDDTLVSGRIVPQLKSRAIRAMSIGFNVNEERNEGSLRILEKIDLWEVSLVVFPANTLARITSVDKNVTPAAPILPAKLSCDDVEVLHRRELETMFTNGCPMSGKLSKKVASLLAEDLRDVGDLQPAPRDVDAKDKDELSVFGRGFDALNQALKGNHHARSPRDRIQI